MKVEHKWNLLLLASLSVFSINQVNAEFIIIKPLERGQGGSLVDGTISFKTPSSNNGGNTGGGSGNETPTDPTDENPPTQPEEIWTASTPVYGEWVVNETLYGCNWTPSTNTKPAGYGYTIDQQSTSCSKDTSRTVQDREYNAETNEYRNVSTPYTETTTETVNSVTTRTANATGILGSKSCRYLVTTGSSSTFYWETVNSGGTYIEKAFWGGESYTVNNSGSPITFALVDRYLYLKDVLKKTEDGTNTYQVCRQPITNFSS